MLFSFTYIFIHCVLLADYGHDHSQQKPTNYKGDIKGHKCVRNTGAASVLYFS